jgi:hypothetical protein
VADCLADPHAIEIVPIDTGFAQRRELWRLFGYVAVVTVDGQKPFGRRILTGLANAVRSYLSGAGDPSRIGGWRIIFSVNRDRRLVGVSDIGPRGQVYRGL